LNYITIQYSLENFNHVYHVLYYKG